MAKTPKNQTSKKTPAAGDAEASNQAPKSKTRMVIAAAAVLALAGGGGVYWMKRGAGAHAAGHDTAHAAGHGVGDAHGGPAGKATATFLDVRDMVVNLAPDPGQAKGGFLKLKVVLELAGPAVEAEVRPLMPRVEDAFQTYMRELRAGDLSGSAGLHRLREELLRRVNIAVHPARAEAVLFKDMVVQ